MVNKVILIGNVGKDPDLKTFENGNAVCEFSVATNETYKDKQGEKQTKTEWHNITIWGKSAEPANKYVEKGKLVYIEGKIETQKWQDNDGNDRYTTKIISNQWKLLSKKEESEMPF